MDAFICEAKRTPIGKYGGALSSIRADDLAALPIKALYEAHPNVHWATLDEVVFGCANQAGEDNRNVARMASLLAGLPVEVPGITINRLCASGLDAVGLVARAIKVGEYDLAIAGGIESMTRAPFVMPKSQSAFDRKNSVFDTTIGWRFINKIIREKYGIDSMPETADNVAKEFNISRSDQDAFAIRSQQRWEKAQKAGIFEKEIFPVNIPQRKGDPKIIEIDEHPRPTISLNDLNELKGINGPNFSVTAGNSSGVNDGAAALLMTSKNGYISNNLKPRAKVITMQAAGVEPKIMGIGPVSATKKALAKSNLKIDDMDVIELNEAFAAQALATMRALGVPDDSDKVNPNGGAIAMGHPLGMSGARMVLGAMYELERINGRYALCTMCVGVGQGVAMILETA